MDTKQLLQFYRQEHRIYGKCPYCSETFRLSEVKLTSGKEPPRDMLTQLKKERDRLNDQVAEMEAQLEQSEEEHEANLDQLEQEWENKLDTEVDKRLEKRTKEIRRDAIERSRVTTLGKTIERIAPMFSGFGFHPGDVRPLFDPVDFVIFDGLWSRGVTELVFVEFKTGASVLTPVQKSIRDAVAHKRVRFEEKRISRDRIQRIVNRPASNQVIVQPGKKPF